MSSKQVKNANKEKPMLAYLQKDFPYQGTKVITNIDLIEATGSIYEIKCEKCGMSIRTQGKNLKVTYERLVNDSGCIGCGNMEFVVRQIDMDGKT